jgi:flagellin
VSTSADGVAWMHRDSGTSRELRSVTWNKRTYLAVGDAGTILASADGTEWESRTSESSANLRHVLWTGTRFLVVGRNVIMSSNDGNSWDALAVSGNLTSVTWNGINYVAVGEAGVILASTDGENWLPQPSGVSENFNAITWDGRQFIAVGNHGKIVTSSDGLEWNSRFSGTDRHLFGIAQSCGQIITVGESATILNTALSGAHHPFLRTLGLQMNGFVLHLSTTPGCTYIVEHSSDLREWMVLNVVLAEREVTDIVDIDAGDSDVRFYRVRVP